MLERSAIMYVTADGVHDLESPAMQVNVGSIHGLRHVSSLRAIILSQAAQRIN